MINECTKYVLWLCITNRRFPFLALLVHSSRVRQSDRAARGEINLQVFVKKKHTTHTPACSPTFRPMVL
ncbi:hypothetical protein ATANTOWER_012182 [Ataeniobius toweri]|uniref:Secreted protein n=1 Tax=Ataeniobius toweri TaxID=208326 RepID=A0ABU7AJ24_9TELE|nr:hypothetical protein [Ataeniobius toweri]